VSRYLSPAWLDELTNAVAELGVVHEGPPGSVEVRVPDSPDGLLVWHVQLVPGEPPRYGAGPLADAASSYDQTWADANAQLRGNYQPVVGFMQGTLKVKGATRPLYEIFRLWASPQHAEAWSRLAATAEV
jgi:hypothetical protein